MANYQLLKADIDEKVYQNGAQEITGANLNSVLNAMVTTLGAEYQFAGVATIDTNPGTPDAKVFYIANGKGTYTNFGGLEVTEDEVVVLYWDSSWHKVSTGIASQSKLSELESEYGSYISNEEYLRAYTDNNGVFLWGIRIDGSIEFAKGVPQPIQKYIAELLSEVYTKSEVYSKSEVDGEAGSKGAKVDKEIGKSLISQDIASSLSTIISDEFISVELDKEGRIISATLSDGTKYYATPINVQGTTTKVVESPQYLSILLDNNNRILAWFDKEGNFGFAGNVPDSIKQYCNNIQEDLSKDIEEIDGIRKLPSYYFENNYIDNKIVAINAAISSCARNGDAFFWITDVHWEPDAVSEPNARISPSLIKYIARKTNINRLLCGGDVTHVGNSEMCTQFLNMCRNAIGSNHVYTAYGNHEFISYKSYDEVFHTARQFNDDVVYGGDDSRSCFYVNNNQQKIRYIALGSFGKRDSGTGQYESLYTQYNLNWFVNEALNVDSGWTIIIFTHSLYTLTNLTGIESYDEKDYTLTPIKSGEVWTHEYIGGECQFIDAIDNYSGNGTIACVLIGHTHSDRIHIGKSGVPYIISASDQCLQTIMTTNVPRAKGTITEQHFEVVVIDKNQRKVSLIAIGGQSTNGIDNDMGELVEVREVRY